MRGKTIVFAWELGGGLGHAAPLAAVARRVASRGARAVLAFRHVEAARIVAPDDGFTVIQAPVPARIAERSRRRASGFADTLAVYGFDDPDVVARTIDAWRDLFRHVEADLVVADYSPGASLAARGGWPVVQIGNGFCLPPDHIDRFPCLIEGVEPIAAQERLLDGINEALRRRGVRPLDRLPALLGGSARLLRSIAWADPYADDRREPYLGPMDPMPPPSPRPAQRRLYAYINASMPRFRQATAAFAAMNAERSAFIRGVDAAMCERLAARGVNLHAVPPPLTSTVTDARALLSNGTSALCHAALAAGRPVVAIPTHIETILTARLLARHGAVLVPPSEGRGPAVRQALEQALSDPHLEARAAAAARQAGPFDAEAALTRATEACAAALGGEVLYS